MERHAIFAVVVVLVALAMAPFLSTRTAAPVGVPASRASAPAASWALRSPAKPVEEAAVGGSDAIERGADGQFHVDGEVEGEEVRFLVDTGADVVALTAGDAERAGIVPEPESFRPLVRSATGTGWAALVRIGRLTVGSRELSDVEAMVVRGLPVSLLGQTALQRLGTVTLEGDRLLIGG